MSRGLTHDIHNDIKDDDVLQVGVLIGVCCCVVDVLVLLSQITSAQRGCVRTHLPPSPLTP